MALVKKPVARNRSHRPPNAGPSSRQIAGLVFVAVALLYGVRLGNLDFWAPDEARYGAIAEELRSFRHGAAGLVLLHLNDTPYTQKPPLYFWLAALVGTPGERVTEFAARLPSAVAGLACVALTALIGRWLLGNPLLALLASALLATSFRFAWTARRAQLDVLLTSFELMAVALFVWIEFKQGALASPPAPSEEAHPPSTIASSKATRVRPSTLAIASMHAALGAAALVKGPVAWLPLAIFAAYLAWEGRIRRFRVIAPLWAWSLSLAPVCLWIAGAVALAPSGFARVAVHENLIGRFFAGTSHARPFYYFLVQTPADFLPWTLLLPFGVPILWRWARPTPAPTPAPPAPPSPPSPLSPPSTLSPLSPPRNSSSSPARFILVWIALPLLFFSVSAGKRGVYLLPIFPALALVAALGAARVRAFGRIDRVWIRRSAIIVACVAGIEFGGFAFGLPLLEAEKSPRAIAESAARATRPDESVGIYGLEPIEGAIAYYGDRSVTSLEHAEALQSFLDRGGRAVLLRARHFDELGPSLALEEIDAFRSGRRKLVLAGRRPNIPEGIKGSLPPSSPPLSSPTP